ncbi:MAG: hypothetical protein IKK89_02250 [Alistipes sp.]|nr:hypothetical protein [Alistipes sp.]MBR6630753.1 hypothetical protein [Alistipes sp.]
MRQDIRLIISIVISAVLLGLVVVYCINAWMPTEPNAWILWGASVAVGISAIYRISNLAKALGMLKNDNKEKE